MICVNSVLLEQDLIPPRKAWTLTSSVIDTGRSGKGQDTVSDQLRDLCPLWELGCSKSREGVGPRSAACNHVVIPRGSKPYPDVSVAWCLMAIMMPELAADVKRVATPVGREERYYSI